MNAPTALNHSNLLGPNWKHWEGIAPVSRLDVRIKVLACVAKYAPKYEVVALAKRRFRGVGGVGGSRTTTKKQKTQTRKIIQHHKG